MLPRAYNTSISMVMRPMFRPFGQLAYRFANRQLGLDLQTLQAFQEQPVKDPELLRLVLYRF